MRVSSPHEHNDDALSTGSRLAGVRHRLRHLLAHDHEPDSRILDTGTIGIRATKVSLVGLGITAVLQAMIFVFSGSVALLSDTLHNVTDALTAIPLWIAFSLGRRPASRRYTYGFNRAEDWAGLAIVLAIGFSAVMVVWESVQRLVEPRLMSQIPWVITAGVIGAFGNEAVARYRIRVGESIGSQALVSDGHHARTDALTSVAVVAAGVGAGIGLAWIDPVAGLIVAVPIVWLLGKSARRVARRLLDGIEPEVVDMAATSIHNVEGVKAVDALRMRWNGHQLRIAASVSVDPHLSVKQGHEIAHNVEHALHHQFNMPVVVTIHIEPHDQQDRHDTSAHHGR